MKRAITGTVMVACVCILLAGFIAAPSHGSGVPNETYLNKNPVSQADRKIIEDLLAGMDESRTYPLIEITDPLNGALFPVDIAAPEIAWNDNNPDSVLWLVRITFEETTQALNYIAAEQSWTPHREAWEIIKKGASTGGASIAVLGLDTRKDAGITGSGSLSIAISPDPVDAPLLYMQMPLPFAFTQEHPEMLRWSLADLSSYEKPPVVLEKMPVCGNCHSFSRNGKVLGMDIDYRGDKGGYFLSNVKKRIDVAPSDIISWGNCKPSSKTPVTFGFFPKISPDGSWVIATVEEKSFFIRRNEPAFSQFFFLAGGELASYSRADGRFQPLSGADDPAFVQTAPDWSPDGRYIIFSRAPVDEKLVALVKNRSLFNVDPDTPLSELNNRYRIRYDLYRVPFNNGAGGVPEPVAGASANGMSNYFARYSPNGKWIVYCQSENGLALQPDSRLYIIPAEGGKARKLKANRGVMNSWHSWSPNGKWLVFSSKDRGPFTAFYLCHIDEAGNDSVPVLLTRLNERNLSNMVPEFGNIAPEALKEIRITEF